jgi:anti-anti-sigma factor
MPDQPSIVVEQEADGRSALKLVGEMSPLLAADLQRTSVQLVERGQDVVVHCDQLQSLDMASLQILVSLKESLSVQQKGMQLADLSAEMVETIGLAGLQETLGLTRDALEVSSSSH